MSSRRDIFNLPNLVSSIRILIAPLLFYLAFQGLETWFLAALLFSGFTDVLDGFLARNGTPRVNARSITMTATGASPGQTLDADSSIGSGQQD